MATAKKVKKVAKKTKKAVKEAVRQTAQKATRLKKQVAKIKGKGQKLTPQKDALIKKLREELATKENQIRASARTLKEAIEKAGKEVTQLKEKTNQSFREVQEKVEAEAKQLRKELEAKGQTLREKATAFEEYRKAAESKISELQGKLKEWPSKGTSRETEKPGVVTFKGKPLTLLGPELRVGDKAPDFQVLDNAMQPVTLESYKGQVKIISAVPSLDTPVCDMETRRFNEEAGKLPEKVTILTISMDLPFAQARWCAAAGVEKVKTFSDYRDRSFGLAYGVLIKELKLLARTVFIVDEQEVIRYVERVPEITKEPDYESILNAVRALL
jgi:thiol peroxidase